MDYAFKLNWDELDEELREEKMDDYILHNMEEYKFAELELEND
jgi:hypothetical protein